MATTTNPDTTALVLVNLILLGGCLACLLAVLAGVVYELWWRRHMRRSLPDAWPPVPPRSHRPRRRAPTRAPARGDWPPLPEGWPPIEEESKR